MSNLGKILAMQSDMMKMEQAEIKIVHHHIPGVYCREMIAPAGSLIVGKMHQTEHLNILSKGKVAIYKHEDDSVVIYEAPCMVHSLPGTKRVLLGIEDYIWTNIHYNPDNLQSDEEMEKYFVVEPGNELEFIKHLMLEDK